MNMQEEIRRVAYELYEKSGRIGGREIENWLAAEKIVMSRKAQTERGIKTGTPAANRTPKETAVKVKPQKTKAKDVGPKGIAAGKAETKKTAPKKTKKVK